MALQRYTNRVVVGDSGMSLHYYPTSVWFTTTKAVLYAAQHSAALAELALGDSEYSTSYYTCLDYCRCGLTLTGPEFWGIWGQWDIICGRVRA